MTAASACNTFIPSCRLSGRLPRRRCRRDSRDAGASLESSEHVARADAGPTGDVLVALGDGDAMDVDRPHVVHLALNGIVRPVDEVRMPGSPCRIVGIRTC